MFLPVAHWAMYTLYSTHCGPLGRLYHCSCHTAPLARRCWCAEDTGAPSAGRHRPHAGTSSESLTTELKHFVWGEKHKRTSRTSVRGGRGVREGCGTCCLSPLLPPSLHPIWTQMYTTIWAHLHSYKAHIWEFGWAMPESYNWSASKDYKSWCIVIYSATRHNIYQTTLLQLIT